MEWVAESHAAAILRDSPGEILDRVRSAYLAHARGGSVVPRSMLLRPLATAPERFIALPAFLSGDTGDSVGIKWIASFPDNVKTGQPRASAIIVLNSTTTGQPVAILGGAAISAARTGASAAIAAQALGGLRGDRMSFIGAGPINLSVFSHLHHLWPQLRSARIFDVDQVRASHFAQTLSSASQISVEICNSVEDALDDARLLSIATNVVTPFIADLSACDPAAVVLHVSLRDIKPDALADCDNVTDDVNHVLSANTSLDLLNQQDGSLADAIATLGEVLERGAWHSDRRTVFSPFGLGSLDIAVADLVLDEARRQDLAIELPE